MLTGGDKQWIEKAIVKGVVEGINQVMIPYSEDQEKRFEAKIDGLRDELKLELGNKIDRLERKLDIITDHQADVLDRHEQEIGRLKLIVGK